MKLSKYKEIIINKFGKKEWERCKNTYQYSIYSSNEEEQKRAVQIDGLNIQYIHNPSEEIQLLAVKNDGFSLEYIDNPSEKVKIKAIENISFSIKYIHNPSEELQLLAVMKNPSAITEIKNPTEKVIQETIKGIDLLFSSECILKHLENDLKEE